METTALCPLLKSLPFFSTTANRFSAVPTKYPTLLSPPSWSKFPAKNSTHFLSNPVTTSCSASPPQELETENDDEDSSHKLAVLLQVEGVLVDAYRLGNRRSFNTAFQKLGLDCANWSEPVYLDLVRKSLGDEEKMLTLYFNRIGWPTSLPTSEKGSFIKSVLREKGNALDDFLVSTDLPLRPGAEEFIDDAYNEGVPVVLLTAYSKSADRLARSISEKLGSERAKKVKIIGNEEVEQSMYGRVMLGKQFSSGLKEEMAEEAKKAVAAEKLRIAEKVASTLKLSVEIDTTSTESLEKIISALRAGAESVGLPVYNCVFVAGNQSSVAGAERVGMPCVVLRSSLTSRAEFPSAKATLDGFGGADLTISKLRQKRWS